MDMPLNAEVECVDGAGGRSEYIIINPATNEITHIVIREKGLQHAERLVSVEEIVETTPDSIRLDLTQDQLARQESFVERSYALRKSHRYNDIPFPEWPYAVAEEAWTTPVKHLRIPPGEVAVRRGAHVEASDGTVGQVREFLVDPISRQITHMVVGTGHLWSKKSITIPATDIDQVGEEEIFVNLEEHDVDSLPADPG